MVGFHRQLFQLVATPMGERVFNPSLWTRCAGMGRSDEHLAAGVAWPPGVSLRKSQSKGLVETKWGHVDPGRG
jgi:hypothetical protein